MAREGRPNTKRERALISLKQEPVSREPMPCKPTHDCNENAEYVDTDGALGQAWYCNICGTLLQVG